MFTAIIDSDLIILRKALQTKIRIDEEIMLQVDRNTVDKVQLKMQAIYNKEISEAKSLLIKILDEIVSRNIDL